MSKTYEKNSKREHSSEIHLKICKICGSEKKIEQFYKCGEYYKNECKYCNLLQKRNKKIIQKNMGIYKSSIDTWHKHKWKYNTRRKIMRIIGYLDGKGRISDKVTESQLMRQKITHVRNSRKRYSKFKHIINTKRTIKRKIGNILKRI